MAPKADKLSQSLENFQFFLRRRFDDCEEFKEISRKLSKLQINLQQKKLVLQVVSSDLSLAQGLFDLINTNELLKEFYQLKFDSLPHLPQQQKPQPVASVKFKQIKDGGTDIQQYYQLNDERELSLGRSRECDIVLDSKLYRGVSWNHAVIQPVTDQTNDFQWQICDRQSTNGTFVNGEKIQQCQVLKSGDTITLAYPQNGIGIAEFIWEIRLEAIDTVANQEYWDMIDCDLLLIAINSKQPLSVNEKDFIQNFDHTFISKQYIVADILDPKKEADATTVVETKLAQLETWLKAEVSGKDFELLCVSLQPYCNENTGIELDAKLLKKQDQFFKVLENTVKRQPENILAKRLSIKAIRELEPVKPFLQAQQKLLIQNIELEELNLASSNQINWKDVTKKTIGQVEREKDTFFKQIKSDFSQSKAAMLDNYSKQSIVYKIQIFVDNLNPTVVTKNGQKFILLNDESRPDCNDINASLIDFCIVSLKKWSTEEWQKNLNVYSNGGLNGFLDRAYDKVNFLPDIFSESPFVEPDKIDMQNIFLLSFAGTSCETIYKQKSLLGYVVKELRSNLMATMMPIMLLIPLVVVDNKVSKGKIFGTVAQIFNQYPWIFGIVVCAIIYFLINSYNRDGEEKLEEASQKLKKDLAGYYQSFSKNLLDKVVQDINLALESEDKKIIDSLEFVNNTYTERTAELEKQQIQIKNNLEQYKTQQKNLEAELSEFDKLTR